MAEEFVVGLFYSPDGSNVTSGNPIEIHSTQISVHTLSRMFNLNPESIWLQQRYGRKVFFPDYNTLEFDFSRNGLEDMDHLLVRGTKISSTASGSSVVRSPIIDLSGPSSSSAVGTPSRPLVAPKKSAGLSVKIIQASMKRLPSGKIEFGQQSQTFIDLKEETANAVYITNAIQSKWGSEYIIVTADGLPIEDCSGTTGLKFWKVGSRKIFAVKREFAIGSTRRTSSTDGDYWSDDDDFYSGPPLKISKETKHSTSLILKEIKEVRKEIRSEIRSVERKIENVNSSDLPPSFKYQLYCTFMCHICQGSPVTPPIIFSACCKRIIGCKACIDSWYVDPTRSCPLCRAEGACNQIMEIRGLDDFITATVPFFNPEEGPSDD